MGKEDTQRIQDPRDREEKADGTRTVCPVLLLGGVGLGAEKRPAAKATARYVLDVMPQGDKYSKGR